MRKVKTRASSWEEDEQLQSPQSHVDKAKAAKQTPFKQHPESCSYGVTIFLEEGFMNSLECISYLEVIWSPHLSWLPSWYALSRWFGAYISSGVLAERTSLITINSVARMSAWLSIIYFVQETIIRNINATEASQTISCCVCCWHLACSMLPIWDIKRSQQVMIVEEKESVAFVIL